VEVKWIKIVTNIFDDEKIRYIESMPNGNETIVIWFRILCLAGKSNTGGLLMMTDRIAYTEDMLASIFQRDVKSIQLALNIFESLEMIERMDNKIYLTNWEKHQNIDSLEKIRLATKNRVSKHREKQKEIGTTQDVTPCNVTVTPNVTQSNATELELDKERDKEIKNIKKYGVFENVSLSDDEYSKLEEKNLLSKIDDLSAYMKSTGKKYKSHNATILNWSRMDDSKKQEVKATAKPIPAEWEYNKEDDSKVNMDELLKKLKEMDL
jgi:predicted phage replisome organizer